MHTTAWATRRGGFAVYVSFNKTAPPEDVWEYACPENGWGETEHLDVNFSRAEKHSFMHFGPYT